MKNYRLFFWALVTVSAVFLCGFNQADDPLATYKDPKKQATAKHIQTSPADKTLIDDNKELKAPLDLTVPFNDTSSNGQVSGQAESAQKPTDTLFVQKPKKVEQPVQLKGGWLMSTEPEVEKRKSVDGAGIVIDLKP